MGGPGLIRLGLSQGVGTDGFVGKARNDMVRRMVWAG